ncbi:phosphate ABC transporter permease subunit PstC [Frankia sp. CNm7]|uniref:Phosphate transport system permease protein n=1 Tax=Frankia nepalensis TaxID=1836974 RepID=A0A937RLD2_9ACTN|nr:phosphate ABC transporter permease subunit PstC [Frankia nepalensis]MBL7495913.1 phosphate ABC transporter permease subunit PstC [Frankia nepalensis]MBL7513857.1 phosphate ABC transporter permease subunit PstC [Frankia nepalensis]MBL7518377.1 phosphate ABC transporter permease subunit PstC [Frankia nepalensis]MBL7632257.1 phosphate ABC transporter permease subunit PstC [Frankia nepalensis]
MTRAESTAAGGVAAGSVSLRRPRPRYGEAVIRGALFAAALLSVATTVGIVVALIVPTVEFFAEVSVLDFLTGTEWAPLFARPKFGVLPLLVGTLVVTVVALIVAIPLGLGAATFLSEYATDRVRRVLKPVLEVLAGIPTVVYGFFALTFVTPLLQDIWLFGDPPEGFNALSAGIVMGIMIVPTVASLSEDAMSAVPADLKAGGYALGSSKRQVATRVTFPAALSGIVAAIVLAISRAVGETMIVLVAAGGTPNLSADPREAMQTMTAFIGAAGIGDQPVGSIGYKTIFAVGSLLFVITLVMNAVSIRLVRKFREVYE